MCDKLPWLQRGVCQCKRCVATQLAVKLCVVACVFAFVSKNACRKTEEALKLPLITASVKK